MARTVIAVGVLLALCQVALCVNPAPAPSPVCAPPLWGSRFLMVQSSVLAHGYMAEDTTQMALFVNQSGVSITGSPYEGIYLYANSTGYWITGGQCSQIHGPVPDWSQRCLPAGNIEQKMIGGVLSNVYEHTETGPDGAFANATLYMFTADQNIPISSMTYSVQNEGNPANLQSFTFYEPSLTVDTSIFEIPSICEAARPIRFEEIENHHALKRGARLA